MELGLVGKDRYLVKDRSDNKEYGSRQERLAAMNRLAAGVAHEIRNPLTEVFGFVQLLERSLTPDQKQQEYFTRIYEGVKAINTIVGRLVLLNSCLHLNLQTTSIADIVQKLLERARPLAEKQGTSITCSLLGPIPDLRVDPEAIGCALYELVVNALEALESGGEVTVTARYPGGKKRVIIEVKDNGRGVEGKSRPYIYEPFYSSKPFGVGLGLSLARSIVEVHGGSLSVVSQEGEGTTFFVELPSAGIE